MKKEGRGRGGGGVGGGGEITLEKTAESNEVN